MDRRQVLQGIGAIALSQHAVPLLSSMLEPPILRRPPANLLKSTFGPIKSSLLAYGEWMPFPKPGDAVWSAVPAALSASIEARAKVVSATPWEIMLATEELEFRRNGNRSRFEAITFGRRNRLSDLVLAECIENDGRYVDQIANGVWLLCEETFWGAPAHLTAQKAGVGLADSQEPILELFSAETAATLALTSYLLGPQLSSVSPLLNKRILDEFNRRVLTPYLTRDDFSWMGLGPKSQRVNNWNPWINSNVLMSSLLLAKDAMVRSHVVQKVCQSTDVFLADYSPDAGCEEGPGYWNRSAASFYDVCWCLVSAHAGQGDEALKHPFVREMGEYIANAHIAGSFYLNYGDAPAHGGAVPDVAYRFGRDTSSRLLADFGAFDAARRGTTSAQTLAREATGANRSDVSSFWRDLARTLVAKEIEAAPRKDALVRDVWYPDLALMVARQAAGSTDGFYLAVQAASNGRSHGHNDSGSPILFLNGEPIFIDVGPEAYSAKTFGKDRYTLWTMQSAYHNLPTIGGIQQHEGAPYQATSAQYKAGDTVVEFSANLASAYPAEADVKRWIRTLTLDRKEKCVALHESGTLGSLKEVVLSFMTTDEPAIERGSVTIGRARLSFDPEQVQATKERISITDAGLRASWNDSVFRLTLMSLQPISSFDWHFVLTEQK